MGDRTAVDTVTLAAAAAAATTQSHELAGAAGASTPALGRLAADLAGARSAPEVVATCRAADGLLDDLGQALARLGRLLLAAAAGYAAAERSASSAATPSGSVSESRSESPSESASGASVGSASGAGAVASTGWRPS